MILDGGESFADQWSSSDTDIEITTISEGIVIDNVGDEAFEIYVSSSFGDCINYAFDTIDIGLVGSSLAMSDEATTAFAEWVQGRHSSTRLAWHCLRCGARPFQELYAPDPVTCPTLVAQGVSAHLT